ncbi:hypothetical protein [Cellulomonas sp. 73-145]|uniref:hypothetical protein n=1 Tax=Cellulomonas sp. 73-145 TaxID=1895739 RepID=UPI001AC6883D|nr:hypothetical protein [Cellulomonas sp. 73-145]MBN9326703.1 hypothetical protein [Cellulomonas sp.]
MSERERRGGPLRVLFLIANTARARERIDLVRAARLRDEIEDGEVHGAILVGPRRDTDPATWSRLLRKWSGRADLVIVEGHGGCLTGHVSCIDPLPEYAIGTQESNWRPVHDANPEDRPAFGLVLLGSCNAATHLDRIATFFASWQRFIACAGVTHGGDVERVYRPVLDALTTEGIADTVPVRPWGQAAKVEAALRSWSVTSPKKLGN